MNHQVISVTLQFGDQNCEFQSTFLAEDKPQALSIAVSIARASANPQAMVHVNGVLIYGQHFQLVPGGYNVTMALLLVSPLETVPTEMEVTTKSPQNDHLINLLIQENKESFAFNMGLWNISQNIWFGDVKVAFTSFFISHKVPLAWARSTAMAKASGKLKYGSIILPASWSVNLPADYWD
jgi:hypothetical protein